MASRSKKVLLFGYNQSNFILPIYRFIKFQSGKDFEFFAFNIIFLGDNLDSINGVITLLKDNFRKKKRGLLKGVFSSILRIEFYNELKYGLKSNNKINTYKKLLTQWLMHINYQKTFEQFDIIHVQYCAPIYMRYASKLKNDKILICSVWGSDFLTQQNINEIYIQKKAFNRANVITIQTEELKKMFIAKYGYHLKDKIKILHFGISEEHFNSITELSQQPEKFLMLQKKFGIISEKFKIVLGTNRSKANNHLKLIEQISRLEANLINKIQIIIPFAYGAYESSYLISMQKQLDLIGIDYIINDKYLKKDELALQRLSADLFLQFPNTDALSATLAEFLFSGTICICGKWLPYNFYKELAAKDQFHQLESFDQLPLIITEILNASFQRYPIQEQLLCTSEKNILPKWLAIYKNL